MPETEDDLPATRAARRSQREATSSRGRSVGSRLKADARPLEVIATVVYGLLFVLTAFAGWGMVAANVVLGGFVLSWGWPRLLDSPSPRGTAAVIALSTVLATAAVLAAGTDPFLRHLPVAVAGSIVAMFLHQLFRRDARPRLTHSLTVTASAVVAVVSGAAFIPLPLTAAGPEPLAVAGVAMAVAAPVDLYAGWPRLRPWLLPLAVLVGSLSALVVTSVGGDGHVSAAVVLAMLSAGVSHAMRRVIGVLPPIGVVRSQLTAAAASVLVPGLVVYTLSRVLTA